MVGSGVPPFTSPRMSRSDVFGSFAKADLMHEKANSQSRRLVARSPSIVFFALAAFFYLTPIIALLWNDIGYFAPPLILFAYALALLACMRRPVIESRTTIISVFAQVGLMVGFGAPVVWHLGIILIALMEGSGPAQGLTIVTSVLLVVLEGVRTMAIGSIAGAVVGAAVGWITARVAFAKVDLRG